MTYNLFYLLRWLIFLVRWQLAVLYGVLEFFSKPGSRVIVPIAAAALGYVFRQELHRWLIPYALAFDPAHRPEPLLLDAVLVIALIVGSCAYLLFSRALGLVLAALPAFTRPLHPLRRLKVKTRIVRPAIVHLAVPKLPRRRAKLRLTW